MLPIQLLKYCRHFAGWAGLLLGSACAFGQAPPSIVELNPAVAVDITGDPGKTYSLYSSSDLTNWSPVGVRQFGVGQKLGLTDAAGAGAKFYRYVVDTQPTGGLAPWNVAGITWNLQAGQNETHYQFANASSASVQDPGQASPQSAAYTCVRTGEDTLEIQLTLPNNILRKLTCTFLTNSIGTLTSQDQQNGSVIDSTSGIFFPPPPPAELVAQAPAALGGETLLLQESAGPVLAGFASGKKSPTTSESLKITPAANYLATSDATATFTIADSQRSDSYQLKLLTARTGTFFRKRLLSGLPAVSHSGVFVVP